jgi:hypothetical protein
MLRPVPEYSDYLEADPASQFLGRLDLLRKDQSWSVNELARRIAIPSATLRRWNREPDKIPVCRAQFVERKLSAMCLAQSQNQQEVEGWLLKQLENSTFVAEQERPKLFERVAGHCAVQLASSLRNASVPVNFEEVTLPAQVGVQVVLKDNSGGAAAQVVFMADEFTLRYKAFQRQSSELALVFEGVVDRYALGFCREFLCTLFSARAQKAGGLEKKINKKIDEYYKQQRIGTGYRSAAT